MCIRDSLTFVNSGYGQFAIIFPLLVAAPRYFSGKLTLGGLMQINSAFREVQGALSWFVDSYATLVGWKAAANRLIDFQEAIRVAERQDLTPEGPGDVEVVPAADPAQGDVTVSGLALALPVRGGTDVDAEGVDPLHHPVSYTHLTLPTTF